MLMVLISGESFVSINGISVLDDETLTRIGLKLFDSTNLSKYYEQTSNELPFYNRFKATIDNYSFEVAKTLEESFSESGISEVIQNIGKQYSKVR